MHSFSLLFHTILEWSRIMFPIASGSFHFRSHPLHGILPPVWWPAASTAIYACRGYIVAVPSNPSKEPSSGPVKADTFSMAAAIFATGPYPPAFQPWRVGGFLPVSWHHFWQRPRRFAVAGMAGEGDLAVGGFCQTCCSLTQGSFGFKLGQDNLCSLVPLNQKLGTAFCLLHLIPFIMGEETEVWW